MFWRKRCFTDGVEVVLVHERKGLLVGQALIAANHGVGKVDCDNVGLVGKRDKARLGEPILRFDQTAETVGECVRKHGYDGAHEVRAVSSLLGFDVERCAWFDVGTHIRDVHTDTRFAAPECFD